MERDTDMSKKPATASIRLLTKTVQFIAHIAKDEVFSETGYRFSGIGSDQKVHDLPKSLVLNSEEIDEAIREDPRRFLRLVVPESLAWQIGMEGITFSREIDLPK
jgi:hypothetical protein